MSEKERSAISLFSSGGLGDLAVRNAGWEILVSSELREDRHELFKSNFPSTTCISGDIWDNTENIELAVKEKLGGKGLSLLFATPPCQGMSKNGRGKLLNAIRSGTKPPLDERNRLVIPVMDIAKRLMPEILVFENVPEMANTLIVDENNNPTLIVDYIQNSLGPSYSGIAEKVEFANYGVPQKRQRLITIFSRNRRLKDWLASWGSFLPPATHSRNGISGTSPWVSIREALEGLPELDAATLEGARSEIPFHRVPVLDQMKYWWVKNTPPGCGAFDNQCVACGFSDNPPHRARKGANGINRTSLDTPLFCLKCGELLPRPSVERNGVRVLMKGFTSAYRRMKHDEPASALTRNLSYACSDRKLHPEQNRVLSLLEAFRVHSLDKFEYSWSRKDGKPVSDKTIREVIGESIPPSGLEVIVCHLMQIYRGRAKVEPSAGPLFCTQA